MSRPIIAVTTLLALGCADQLGEIPEVFDEEIAGTPCAGKCDGDSAWAELDALPDTSLATLFAPYEPALGLDLRLIEAVVAARAADSTPHYAEGYNPFTIRFAVYNLDNPVIAAALADAEDANVDVQILIEDDQLDPARDWNVMDDYLVARGFEQVRGHKTLDDAGRRTADLIGVTGSGLMHLKTRLYRWVDGDGAAHARVVTGSMNPGHLAVHNDETLHYITIPEVVARYEAKYAAVLRGQKITNTWSDTAGAQVLFTPDGGTQAIDRIARLIDQEQEAILLAVFSLRNMSPTTGGKGILDRIVDAHRRGVLVTVITDRKQSDGIDVDGNQIYWNDPSEEILRAAGVPVYEVVNRHTPFNAMHTKYGIFGLTRPVVVTDAGNWSRASMGSGSTKPTNDESVLFLDTERLDGGRTGLRYLGNFVEILHRYDANPAGELARLQAHPAWPRAESKVLGRATPTWGQKVYVTGSSDELGRWAQRGSIPLTTEAATYPVWTSAPVALPFASRLAYKLIKRQGDAVVWEAGADRAFAVDPTDRRQVTTGLVWR
jgi:hypothetical protein